MGTRVMSTDAEESTCLFDSVTGTAFGPILDKSDADDFLDWLHETFSEDPREMDEEILAERYTEFVDTRANTDAG